MATRGIYAEGRLAAGDVSVPKAPPAPLGSTRRERRDGYTGALTISHRAGRFCTILARILGICAQNTHSVQQAQSHKSLLCQGI